MTTLCCNTICSDPNSEALTSGSHTSPYHSAIQPPNPVFQLHATTSTFPSCKDPLFFFTAHPYLLSLLFHFTQLPGQNSSLFSLSAFLSCASNPVLFISQALSPPASCRNAGVMRDWATRHDFAEICGKQQLGREITDPRKICWKIRKHQVSTAPWQWPWFILFPHGKQEMVFLFAKVYHVYSGVWTCPWEVTMINFLHVSAQLSLLSSQIIMHHMAGKLVISGITLALSASLPLLCPLPGMGLKGETRTIHRS